MTFTDDGSTRPRSGFGTWDGRNPWDRKESPQSWDVANKDTVIHSPTSLALRPAENPFGNVHAESDAGLHSPAPRTKKGKRKKGWLRKLGKAAKQALEVYVDHRTAKQDAGSWSTPPFDASPVPGTVPSLNRQSAFNGSVEGDGWSVEIGTRANPFPWWILVLLLAVYIVARRT